MESIKFGIRKKLIIMFTTIIIVGAMFLSMFTSSVFKEKVIASAQEKLQSDIKLATELMNEKYPGQWKVAQNKLYKGDVIMNDNFEFVDLIKDLTGDTVTIFHGDTRVATNVMKEDNTRALGTKISELVGDEVLNKKTFILEKLKLKVSGIKLYTLQLKRLAERL